MPIFMDRHYVEGATRLIIEQAHEADLKLQHKHGVHLLTYWFDEERSTAFCLADASTKDALTNLHAESHGQIPNEIIEVDPVVVESFLGGISKPVHTEGANTTGNHPPEASPFRTIMFTDLKDSTAITTELGEEKAMHLLRIHNALTRNALREHEGREVKHTGDGIMASFKSAEKAIDCAIAIQRNFQNHNQHNPHDELHLKIGTSAGEPVEEEGDLFGTAVQMAARICDKAGPDQVLVAPIVKDQCNQSKFIFSERGLVSLKGFSEPIQLYEVRW